MSHCIDECYAIYNETHITKSRKPHKCDACEETIPVGHHYWRVFILFDGEKQTVKRCMRYQEIHKHLRSLAPGETWPAEKLDCGESYMDHWGKEPPEEVARLAFALPGELQGGVP